MRALLLAALLLAPLAAADHVYSHRYIIEGRLVGSDGAPLPGREVELLLENVSFIEPCRDDGHRRFTDESGDFRYCFHAHELPRNGVVGAASGNASKRAALDPALRRSTLLLQDEDEPGVAPPAWNETYRVGGRVWRVGPTELEGIDVYGVAIPQAPVNLTVHAPDGSETRFESRTDAFGDFDLVIETPADPHEVLLTVEALGQGQPATLDAEFHRTSLALYLPADVAAARARGTGAAEPAPGSETPRLTPIMLVVVAAALALAIAAARRKER